MTTLSHIHILKLKDQQRIIENLLFPIYEENACSTLILKNVFMNFEKPTVIVPDYHDEVDYIFDIQKKYYKNYSMVQDMLNFKITTIKKFQNITWEELILKKDNELTNYVEKQNTKLCPNQHWLIKIKNSNDPYLIYAKILTIESNIVNLQINLETNRFYLIEDLVFVKREI